MNFIWFIFSLLAFVPAFSRGLPPVDTANIPPHERLIAHAGGEIRKFRYTNSLEALNNSYEKGFKIFELDFELTNDDAVVLLHDWDYSMTHFYNAEPRRYSLSEFKSLKLEDGLTQLGWGEFADWMVRHTDAYIVVDVKNDPIGMLERISKLSPEFTPRIIPQIYKFSEYSQVRELGYDNIILTLYASDYSDKQVINFVKKHQLWAVTMSAERAMRSGLARNLRDAGITTYAHLVDTDKRREKLEAVGIYGFYTAYLLP